MGSALTEKRRVSRIRRKATVKFQAEGKIIEGVLTNFSEVGLFLQSAYIGPIGTQVTIPLEGMVGKKIELQGRIVWSKRPTKIEEKLVPGGMGIELSAAPEEYLRFIAKIRGQVGSAKRSIEERFEVYHRVRFESGGDFLTEYTENLSRGGMFLATSEPIEPGTKIRAKLEIGGIGEPIEVEGMVAYRMDSSKADNVGRTAGLGVQFVNLSPDAKARIDHYIRRLEIHRSSPDRRQIGSIPQKGTFSDFLVPEILLDLLSKRATGTLLLERQGINKLVYIKKGHPIYIESTLRTETLGQYLVRQGKLTPKDLEDSLEELAQSDLHHGELMLRGRMLDGSTLASAFVGHQEEKLLNTFPWFDGTFEFISGTDWPPTISILPLRTYQIIFEGIERWYDAALISTWMGLDEESSLCRINLPPADAQVPPLIIRILHRTTSPASIRKLAEKLQTPLHRMMPAAYSLIIFGWCKLEFEATTDISQPEFKPPERQRDPKIDDMASVFHRWINEDFERLGNVNFYELFGLGPTSTESDITRAYLEKMNRYSAKDIDRIFNDEIREKVAQILSWIRLAYDTLRDPHLRQIYARHGAPKSLANQDIRSKRIEAERMLLSGIRDLERSNFAKARETLEQAQKTWPGYHALIGYLGWALFQENRVENQKKAIELLDQALRTDPSDAHLHYYRGEVHAYLGEWDRAEKHFSQAVRLHSNFVKAVVAQELAREKRLSFMTSNPGRA